MPAGEVIGRALELLEERGWIQGRYGNGDDGYCLSGALYNAVVEELDGGEWQGPFMDALRPIQAHTGGNVALWNDNPKRTFAQVREVFQRAAYEVGGYVTASV